MICKTVEELELGDIIYVQFQIKVDIEKSKIDSHYIQNAKIGQFIGLDFLPNGRYEKVAQKVFSCIVCYDLDSHKEVRVHIPADQVVLVEQ